MARQRTRPSEPSPEPPPLSVASYVWRGGNGDCVLIGGRDNGRGDEVEFGVLKTVTGRVVRVGDVVRVSGVAGMRGRWRLRRLLRRTSGRCEADLFGGDKRQWRTVTPDRVVWVRPERVFDGDDGEDVG